MTNPDGTGEQSYFEHQRALLVSDVAAVQSASEPVNRPCADSPPESRECAPKHQQAEPKSRRSDCCM